MLLHIDRLRTYTYASRCVMWYVGRHSSTLSTDFHCLTLIRVRVHRATNTWSCRHRWVYTLMAQLDGSIGIRTVHHEGQQPSQDAVACLHHPKTTCATYNCNTLCSCSMRFFETRIPARELPQHHANASLYYSTSYYK